MRAADEQELAGLYATIKGESSQFEVPLSRKNGLQILDEQSGFALQKNKLR